MTATETTTTTTTTTESQAARQPEPEPGAGGGGGRRSRVAIVAVLVVSLIVAGVTRWASQAMRPALAGSPGATAAGASLSSMNSFALALLLGGLRGPLVMILWSSSETQKSEKNLEDFDTKVEWIRMLQPEFDTVHIFQIWNKAYNISVQMASLANKYTTILDAIKYAEDVDAARPNNINIVQAIGGIYFDKLGNAAEKPYYRRRVREETLPHAAKQKLRRGDPGWRPLEHDVMLTEGGAQILPEYRDELKYLTKYEPFPYGLSPLALGYNYFKESQHLQREGKQRHAQLSDLVVDSRPALALRGWGEEEWERGRRVELAALGVTLPEDAERLDMELPTANVPLSQPLEASTLTEALFSYQRAADLLRDALAEYNYHLDEYKNNLGTYLSHLDHVELVQALAQADHDYLAALTATGDARKPLMASARENYEKALRQAEVVILRYYTDDQWAPQLFAAFGQGITRENFEERLQPEQLSQAVQLARQVVAQQEYDPHEEDRGEYEKYAIRAATRLQQLRQAMGQ